jgi:hypothetical protein
MTTTKNKRVPANLIPVKRVSIKKIVDKVSTNVAKTAGIYTGIFTHKIPAQPVKVAAKTATYGNANRWPSEFTSANAIWLQCQKQGVDHNSITKVEAFVICDKQLTFINKKGELTRVNNANVAIEVNSYKKHLLNLIKQQVAV